MKEKLSVLFICGWYPSKILPTNGDFVKRHAEAVSINHNVSVIHIITDKKSTKGIYFTEKEVNNVKTYIAYIKESKNKFQKIILFVKAFRILLKKTNHFDVIHLNEVFPFGLFCIYLKWFKRKPFIITEHFTGYLINSKIKISFLQKLISKLIIKRAFAICPVSDYLLENMRKLGFKGNFITVPNVIDTKLFVPVKKEGSFFKLIHISSLKDEHKNIKGMLRVAKLLSEELDFFEWNFIGNSNDELKEYLKNLDIKNCKISFFEYQTHSEIAKFLQKATLCVSFSNYETFGIVIPESISCGTPVISTNTGISQEFDKFPFCKTISIRDEKQLFESIINHKTIFNNLDIYEMHAFVKQKFNSEIISNKFSLLYYNSLN